MSHVLNQTDKDVIVSRYEGRYSEFGYSPKTLDWDKGKQDIRFSILTSQVNLRGKRILDIGCGFGDLNKTLKSLYDNDYEYTGVDIVPSFIKEATQRFGSNQVSFQCGNFLEMELPLCDYAICSGMFNLKMKHGDNLDFIRAVFTKTFQLCSIGFAFDFLSDKVDYTKDLTYHSSPSEILALGYHYSRNVMLNNSYMPFEFSFFLRKDESFDPRFTIFNTWAKDSGISLETENC